MSRILTRLKNVREDDIRNILKKDAESHAKDSLQLPYLWQSEDKAENVLLLFCDYMKKMKMGTPEISAQKETEDLNKIYNNNNYYKSEL